MFGLMTVKAHEAALQQLRAAAARDIVAEQRRNERLATEIAALRPDAEKFRAKRDRDNAGRRERRARNATGAQKSGPARTKKVAG